MKVAVFGAGALGTVYGVRLAQASVDVCFVVREARVASGDPMAIEMVRSKRRLAIERPERVARVPADADVILLAVGTEDLAALRGPLSTSSEAPIVVLTPMLPADWARMRAAFGERVHAALPSVVAYGRDGVVRYWLPPAPTKIDEPRDPKSAIHELVVQLGRAGLRTRLELGVHETNPATTVAFIAIPMVLCLAGSATALAADDALLSLASRACREGARLADRIGRPEPFTFLVPLLAAPWSLPLWLEGLRRLSPEALFYTEEHFARKLAPQHREMIAAMIDLCREKSLPHEAFDEIASRFARAAR